MMVYAKVIREGTEPPIPYEHLIGVTKSTLRHAQCIAFAAVESIREKRSIDI